HIPRGQGWETAEDLGDVFTSIAKSVDTEFLPKPEAVRFAFNYVMGNQEGRLRVQANPAISRADQREVIVLNLTARGKPASSTMLDVMGWFDLGRDWIVRGFTDLTTPLMHKL